MAEKRCVYSKLRRAIRNKLLEESEKCAPSIWLPLGKEGGPRHPMEVCRSEEKTAWPRAVAKRSQYPKLKYN